MQLTWMQYTCTDPDGERFERVYLVAPDTRVFAWVYPARFEGDTWEGVVCGKENRSRHYLAEEAVKEWCEAAVRREDVGGVPRDAARGTSLSPLRSSAGRQIVRHPRKDF